MKTLLLFCISLMLCIAGSAQEPTYVDIASGTEKSIQGWLGNDVTVLIFVKHECPYDKYYIERLEKMGRKYGSVKFVRVNSNKADINRMKAFYTANSLSGIYLRDAKQILMGKLGARKSSEVFLVRLRDNNFEVLYRGAIDSNPLREDDARENYLEDAIISTLAGRKVILKETAVSGCAISH